MLNINGLSVTTRYDNTLKQYTELCHNLNEWNKQFTEICTKYTLNKSFSQKQFEELSLETRDIYSELKFKNESSVTRLDELSSSLQTLQSMLTQKKQNYTEYTEQNNPEKFLKQQEALHIELTNTENMLTKMYSDIPELSEYKDLFSKDDATRYIMLIDTIIDKMNSIKEQYGDDGLFDSYLQNQDFAHFDIERQNLEAEKELLAQKITALQSVKGTYDELKLLADMLDKIPSSCTNTKCPFITKAKEYATIQTQYSDALSELTIVQEQHDQIVFKITSFDNHITKSLSLLREMKQFSMYLNSYASLFAKFPDFKLFSDPIIFCKNSVILIPRSRSFSEFSHVYSRYKELTNQLQELEVSITKTKNYYEYVEKYKNEIQKIENQITEMSTEMQHLYNDKADILETLRVYEGKSSALLSLLSIRSNVVVGLQQYSKLKNTLSKLHKYAVAGKAFETKVSNLRSKISFVQDELAQYERELNMADYNMRTFDEYEKKRDILTEEYGVLETLRKVWSPTTGIPLIFIEGFMNNLLSSANKYLADIWPDQDLIIDGFEIDEKQFFINVKQPDSPVHHDASVCSGAERATLTTVLSLALLKQFPKVADMYNITKFDEVDNPLDYTTSKIFVGILNDLLDDIHCEQSFLISHNDTFDNDVDVILLKNSSEYENRILNGSYNVIYRS